MIKKQSSKQLLLAGEDRKVFYSRGNLYVSDATREREVLLSPIPAGILKRICSAIPLMERILRLRPRCAAWVNENLFLIARKGRIYRGDLIERTVVPEHNFQEGMGAPLNMCRISGLKGFRDGILYGTYRTEHGRVSIWHRDNHGIWTEAYCFPEGRVLHIHNIIADYQNQRLLILTGDSDQESGIWEAKNDFSEMNLLLGGTQQYRACVAFPENGHIVFATDTPLEENYLYDYDEKEQVVHTVCALPGPVIFGAVVENSGGKTYVFSTSVEPDSQITGLRYMVTHKLGQGVKTRESHVFAGNRYRGFREVHKFKKDIWPMGLCQFGNTCFPNGKLKRLSVCPQGVKKYSGKTMEVTY